jgi:hypothetical protein
VRLVARNVLRSIPGQLDRSVFSTPGRYAFCFGEDEEHVGWAPLHVERRYPADVSTVTVHSTSSTILVIPLRLVSPEGLLLVTAGGPGWDASVLMPPHVGRAVTEPVL